MSRQDEIDAVLNYPGAEERLEVKYDWSAGPEPGLKLAALDLDLLKLTFENEAGSIPTAAAAEMLRGDPETILRNTGLAGPDGQLNSAALILFGRPAARRCRQPNCGVDYRVLLPDGREIRHEVYYDPVARLLPRLLAFEELNRYTDLFLTAGFKFAVPEYDPAALREVLVNAFSHRDYTDPRLIEITLTHDSLSVTSPGGYVGGIDADNILYHVPAPCNPRLHAALHSFGLARCSGGIEQIWYGQLRFGRREPVYSPGGLGYVRVTLAGGSNDQALTRFLIDYEDPSLPDIMILVRLHRSRRAVALPKIMAMLRLRDQQVALRLVLDLQARGWVRVYLDPGSGGRYLVKLNLAEDPLLKCTEKFRATYFAALDLFERQPALLREELREELNLSGDQTRYLIRVLRQNGRIRAAGKVWHYIPENERPETRMLPVRSVINPRQEQRDQG